MSDRFLPSNKSGTFFPIGERMGGKVQSGRGYDELLPALSPPTNTRKLLLSLWLSGRFNVSNFKTKTNPRVQDRVTMQAVMLLLALLALLGCAQAKDNPPTVEVYTSHPEEFEKPNNLICHVTNFYPPIITIDLLKNGKEIPNANQTELAFDGTWFYYLTKYVPITPGKKDTYACRVTHKETAKVHTLVLGF